MLFKTKVKLLKSLTIKNRNDIFVFMIRQRINIILHFQEFKFINNLILEKVVYNCTYHHKEPVCCTLVPCQWGQLTKETGSIQSLKISSNVFLHHHDFFLTNNLIPFLWSHSFDSKQKIIH